MSEQAAGYTLQFMAGGGEMGALMRAKEWAATTLGSAETWPQSLKTAVRIMLTSRQPIWIGWGKDLIYLYNDPYKSIIGGKHPFALGLPASAVWKEIWPDIAPMLSTALTGDEGTYVEEQLLIMERNGYPEETYYTFSYSPIPDDDGSAGGIICANTDDTQRVIGERQLATLRDLAAAAGSARNWREACARSARALGNHRRDLPFVLIYTAEPGSARAALAGASGIEPDHAAAPQTVDLDEISPWPIGEVLRTHEIRLVGDLAQRLGVALPSGAWRQAPSEVAVLPIPATGEEGLAGVLVVGLNPYRLFDEAYRGFLSLAAGQVSAAIANAEAYEAERRRAEQLAELDRAKTQFFSNVSHEFRTPLTLMLGPVEDALADTNAPLPPATRSRIEAAHRNALRLLKLVNSLLDFSRIEAGRVAASFLPSDLAALTTELASNFHSAMQRAGLRYIIECQPLSEPAFVDRDMWEKVVLNLLSNAFKFTFEGEVAITLREVGRTVELVVRDTGTGVAPEELPRLFERFHRVEGAKGRTFEGSGIGLALVQELLRLHGGTIRAESELGRGTAFYATIPLGAAHLPPDQVNRATSSISTATRAQAYVEEALHWLPGVTDNGAGAMEVEHDLAGLPLISAPLDAQGRAPSVLLADDNGDMRDYVSRLLRERGYRVAAAADGEQALAAAREAPPDLVLSDMMMPRMDGFGLLKAIRNDSRLRDVPVILLSARAGEDATSEGLDAGADDYLVKPFSARELLARVGANLAMARVRRESTEALRARTAELETLLETVPVPVWFTRARDAERTYCNRAAAELLRIELPSQTSLSAMLDERSQPFTAWIDGQEVLPERLALRRAAHGELVHAEEQELRFANGDVVHISAYAQPIRDGSGAVVGAVCAAIDITERKRVRDALEERVAERTASLEEANRELIAQIEERRKVETTLAQMQRLEAVGQLTSGVAHDFNNLLMVILGNLTFVLRAPEVRADPKLVKRLESMRAAAQRGSNLTSQLLAFSRRQRLEPRPVNLNETVEGMRELLRTTMGSFAIETRLGADLPAALVDPTQLELVVLNLAINARDAMVVGGTLTIETADTVLGEPRRPEEPPAGAYVLVAVRDTGTGMPPEVLARAFEPFFTTKEVGKGSGLGLAQVYGFAKQSGGGVRIDTKEHEGTTVTVFLPRAEDVARAAAVVRRDKRRRSGVAETVVLVVDDDHAVRDVAVALLEDIGFTVRDADSGEAALEILERAEKIDAAVIDFAMPGMNGAETARRLIAKQPNLPVLFVTGYADLTALGDAGEERIIRKPFEPDELERKLITAIGRGFQSSAGLAARP